MKQLFFQKGKKKSYETIVVSGQSKAESDARLGIYAEKYDSHLEKDKSLIMNFSLDSMTPMN